MSLITKFQHALVTVLDNYKNLFSKKKLAIPADRREEVLKLNNLVKIEKNVITLRHAFIECYNALSVPGIVKIFPFLDTCPLRKSLKSILFSKQYSEKALKNAYLNELINDHSEKSEEKQALLAKIQALENDLLEMRKQNHKLHLERNYLLNINRRLKHQNLKLKELLKNNNISLDEYDLENFSEGDISSSPNEFNNINSKVPDITSVEKGEPIISLSNTFSASMTKSDVETLREELSEAQKQIIEMKNQIKLLTESKEKMLNSNLKELQKEIKELDAAEEVIQKMETQYLTNNNTNVKQDKLNEIPIEEPKSPSLPYYFPRTFTR